MRKTRSADEARDAAVLIDGAVNLIEIHGWWDGDFGLTPNDARHCAMTSLDMASVSASPVSYMLALESLFEELPEYYRYSDSDKGEMYAAVTRFNDEHTAEEIIAWMKRVSAKLKEEANGVSTEGMVDGERLDEAGACTN